MRRTALYGPAIFSAFLVAVNCPETGKVLNLCRTPSSVQHLQVPFNHEAGATRRVESTPLCHRQTETAQRIRPGLGTVPAVRP